MGTIINTFSNQKYLKKFPETDILIWVASLLKYKELGFKTKLYCNPTDIPFLKENYIYNLYDEIDLDCFKNTPYLNDGSINDEKFWFIRKIAAIDNEFKIGNTDFVYSDVDIIVFKKKTFDYYNHDIFVWCLEQEPMSNGKYYVPLENSIYCNWDDLSKPKDYVDVPAIVEARRSIVNGGFLYFKKQEYFEIYKKHVLDYVRFNPAICYNAKFAKKGCTLACNAEQRILTGLANQYDWDVGTFDHHSDYQMGLSSNGCHYYLCRAVWRKNFLAYNPRFLNLNRMTENLFLFLQKLIDVTVFSLTLIDKMISHDAFLYFKNKDYINAVYNLHFTLKYVFRNYNNQDQKDE